MYLGHDIRGERDEPALLESGIMLVYNVTSGPLGERLSCADRRGGGGNGVAS